MSSSVWEQLDPDLVPFGQRDPNTLELRAYRKEPNPETLAFLTLSLGALTLLARAGLCSPGTLASLAQSPAPQGYPADASRPSNIFLLKRPSE